MTATAADSSPTASVLTAAVIGVMDGQRATKSTKEKLEEKLDTADGTASSSTAGAREASRGDEDLKLDRLMKQQAAVQQEHVKHLVEMKA